MYVPPQMTTNYIPLTPTTNYSANLMNTYDAVIYSPVFTNGIGTLYFETINVTSNSVGLTLPVLLIDIATNLVVNGISRPLPSGSITNVLANVFWEPSLSTSNTLNATSASDFMRIMRKIDVRQPAVIRIKRDSTNAGALADNYYICVDNIRVSLPPADVVFSKPEAPFEIGYPSVNAPGGQIQCWMDNRPGPNLTSYLGGTRTNVQVVSRWNYIPAVNTPPAGAGWVSPWVTNALHCVDVGNGAGDGERWEGIFPRHLDVGTLEYYFVGAINGVRYQSPDYTGLGHSYPAENPSPKIYSAVVTTNVVAGAETTAMRTPFRFDIRQYPASFGEAVAITDQFGAIPMYLSGTNEWQARISVVGTSISNITWYFKGSGEYLGNYTFSPNTVYWCNQTGIRNGGLPYGDNCLYTLDPDVATNETNRLEVKVVPQESNFVLLTLNTATTNFMAGRGEYQDFNIWNPGDAGQGFFTDTSDKYPKTAYTQNFNSWATNGFFTIANYFGSILITNLTNQTYMWPEDPVGNNMWRAGSFQYVAERTAVQSPNAISGTTWRNQAIRLLGGNQYLGLGYVQGNQNQFDPSDGLRGLGTVSFKARLSQPIVAGVYNYNAMVHMRSYLSSNYVVRVTSMSFSGESPERPSASLIGYYQSPFKFYEYRVTQITDPQDINSSGGITTRDAKVRHEILKWDNGVPAVLAAAESTTTENHKLTSLLSANCNFEFRLYSHPTSGTLLRGKIGSSSTDNVTFADTSTSALKFGTFGIHSSDSTINIQALNTQDTISDGSGVGASTARLTPATDWTGSPLYFNGGNIRSFAPTNHVQVLIGDSIFGPWATNSMAAVTGFTYASFSSTIQTANPKCVRIQTAGAMPNVPSSDIVVDEIICTSWRGEETIRQDDWIVTEGRIVDTGAPNSKSAHLDATQANQSYPQSVVSPQIMGIGTLSFDYRSLTTNATAIQIQYTDARSPNATGFAGWEDLTNIVCNSSTWTTVNVYFGALAETNIYVRFLNDWHSDSYHTAKSSLKSVIQLDNITIWNNPTNSPNDWNGYNVKVTNTETNRWWIDGVNGGRNASLNNSTTDQAKPTQGSFNPYIMSPKLMRGLGRISFIARAYDPAQNASVSVYATTQPRSIGIQDSQWERLHTFTGITNAFYRPFSFTVTNAINNYTCVKLVVDGVREGLPGVQRICIDEVLVTEQIYAKFDISNVKLMLPDSGWVETRQPLEGQDIGVEVQLTNVLLKPSNIVVRVSYVLGTNTWGVMNAPLSQINTRDMELFDEQNRIYRTRVPVITGGIAEQEKNTVVQYLVWATYEDAGTFTVYQQPDTFVNPAWYHPININKQFEPSGRWSPYYIVYDVPQGSVWINELNIFEYGPNNPPWTWKGNPYIEIAMPAWMNLDGWSIEVLSGSVLTPDVRSILLWGTPTKNPYEGANGYAFFVIGQRTPPSGSTVLSPPADYTVLSLAGDNGILPTYLGGLRLKRPMGMYEQVIAYDLAPTLMDSGALWANADPDKRIKYVGSEWYDGSLSFTGTVTRLADRYDRTDSTNTWCDSYSVLNNWTPGAPNIGQIMPDAPMPGGLNVLITSTLNMLNGSQNGQRGSLYMLKVRKNESTNIVYKADDWYRLTSIRQNGIERLPLAPTNTYTLQLNNIMSNVNLAATINLRSDVGTENPPPDLLDWLKQYPDGPLAPTYLNFMYSPQELSLKERYWINANPTTTNVFTFLTRADEAYKRPLYLTLNMALNGNTVTNLQGGSVVKAMSTYSFSPENWFLVSQFILSTNSFDAKNMGRVYINAFPDRPAYFKWNLELADPRSSIFELINVPK